MKSYTHTNQIFVPLHVQQERIDAWKNFWTGERFQLVHDLINKTAPEAGLIPDAFSPFFEFATADYEPDALYEASIIPEGYQSTLMEQSYNDEYLMLYIRKMQKTTLSTARKVTITVSVRL